MPRLYFLLSLLMLLASACAGDPTADVSVDGEPASDVLPDQADGDRDVDCPDAGPATPDLRETVTWETDELELQPGKERYLCFTKPVEADLVVNGYATDGAPFVHHLMVSKLRSPGSNGFAECEKAYDTNWEPIFIAGAGPGKIDFPKGAGHRIAKGQQVVAQMHLLNLEGKPVKGKVAIRMRTSTVADPIPVVSYVFGNPKIELAPKQVSLLTGDCTVRDEVKLIAGFPHMHVMGKSMRLEVGPTTWTTKLAFKRDPFSFHAQSIDPLNLTIPAGSIARLTCEWNNTSDQTLRYGESTHDEMCYFIGFTLNTGGSCLTSLPPL